MKRLISISAVLMLVVAMLVLPAYALSVDMDRKGSIAATMTYEDEPVPGGTLTLYRVASIHPTDAALLHYVQDFENCGVSLNDLGSATAEALATYVKDNRFQGLTQKIDDNGFVKFENLEVGLYLLLQKESAKGFHEISPVLICVPNNEDGVYVYDVICAPKQEVQKESPEKPSTEPTTPPTTEKPTEPPGKLPQTGLTNWPVPILAVCGGFLVIAGVMMVVKGRKSNDEI